MARKIISAWRISELAWILIFRIASEVDFRELFYVANCIKSFCFVDKESTLLSAANGNWENRNVNVGTA